MRKILDKIKFTLTKYKKPISHSMIFIGYLLALIFTFALIINLNIVKKTDNHIYTLDELETLSNDYDCIFILGAGVKKDGSTTPMLRDRLLTGIEVYNNSKIPIFVTGDSEDASYTETVTMKKFLIEHGVPENDILCDGFGLSTYDSIWRAKYVYGYNKILIISQKYHLNRAIYIANELGMHADSIDAALATYSKQPLYNFREYLARVKDVYYTEIRPDAKYTEIWREVNE